MKIKHHVFPSILLVLMGLSFMSFNKANQWNLYKQSKGIQIYYKLTNCDDIKNGLFQNYILYKVVNTTNYNIDISWKNEVWYNNHCTSCGQNKENKRVKLHLKANETIIGNCKNSNLSLFAEYKNHPKVDKLTKFEIIDLSIKIALK